MKKRGLLGILLSLALMMTMMPALAFAEDAPDAEKAETQEITSEHDPTVENAEAQDAAAEDAPVAPKKEKEEQHVVKTEDVAVQGDEDLYRVWVGNTQVTSGNMNDVLRDGGTVKYTPSSDGKSGTLTLKNATITDKNSYYVYGEYTANIHSLGIDLTIVLEGENTVGSSEEGIIADYAIDVCDFLWSGGNLKVQGSGKNTVTSKYSTIYADSNIEISGVSTEAVSTKGDAICSGMGNITISGGTVDATVLQADKEDAAIYASNGDLTISGDDTVVNAEVVGAKESSVENCCALYACENLMISGGKVNAEVRKCNTSEAIFADDGDIKISDAKVIAESDSGAAIYCNESIEIKSTEKGKHSTYVEAIVTSDMAPAIVGYENLTMDSNLAITTPKGGIIDRYYDDEYYYTVMNGDDYATHAVIQPAAYKIDVADTTGGKVKTEPAKAGEGEVVKVVTTPDEGNEVDKIIIVDEDGIETDITEKSAFTMGRSNITVKVTFKKKIVPIVKTTAKTSTRSMTVKWSWDKANGAKSYKVAYRKAGSKKWTVKKTKKTKYVVKGHKMRGLYEYKVAAVTASGDVWSNVNCRYFKGVRTSVKAGKGSIKASWKKDKKASGYEVLVATNKKMKNAQKFKVASSEKSYKVTGLEKGKTYYVKVGPLKTRNGVTYRGIMCKARKVRVK